MKKLCTVLALLGMSLALVSCTQLFGPKPPEPGMIRQAMEDAHVKVETAVKQGDAASIAAIYAEDAELLPPNNPMVIGRQSIQSFWQSFIDMTTSRELTLESLKIDSNGDLASEMGIYTFKFQPKGSNQPVAEIGKYVTVWKQQPGGSWRIVADIWNTNSSPP